MGTLPCNLVGELAWQSPRALLISDLHLSSQTPKGLAAFEALLEIGQQYDSILILGDLFDAYPGDDGLQLSQCIKQVAQLLQHASRYTRIGVMHGNRDFLLGEAFFLQSHTQLLNDPCILTTGVASNAPAVLLSHGDRWCTADLAYQQARKMCRSDTWQKQVLAMTYEERCALAGKYREQSQYSRATSQQDLSFLDVQSISVVEDAKKHNVKTVLHGHTHQPYVHLDTIKRFVLGDWQFDVTQEHSSPEQCAVIAEFSPEGLYLKRFKDWQLQHV